MKPIYLLLVWLLPTVCAAQKADSLFIREEGDIGWCARYRVQDEKSVFTLAKKFAVPAAALADANNLSYADKLQAGKLLKIPLTPANWYNYTPPVSARVAPLYYRATEKTGWKDMAKRLGVSKRQLQDWNTGEGDIATGRVLAVGWIGLGTPNARDIGTTNTSVSAPPAWSDTAVVIEKVVVAPVLSPMEQMFQDQTAGGRMMTTEKGPAAFFPATGGTVKGVHYAFHNSASRGSVVRVHNPSTGRTVYVKVLGPMPVTKQYAGAIIGISAAAKAQLGVRGDARAWCEVSYAGY